MLKSEQEEKAGELISTVKSMLRRKESLIYNFDSSVDKPNVISPSTVTSRDAWVEVTIFNLSDPNDLFDAHEWARLGEMGVDVDTYTGARHNGYNPSVELHKRFD